MAEAAEYLQSPAGLVEAAVAYYGEYRDEIDREIGLSGHAPVMPSLLSPPRSRTYFATTRTG